VHPNPVGEAHISNKMLAGLYDLGVCNGAQTDVRPPITYISVPSEEYEQLSVSPTLSGTAVDDGGTGFDVVRIAIENADGLWLNYVSGTFSDVFDSNIVATMTDTTTGSTSWSITTDLEPGDYRLYALALDNNGNQVEEAAGDGSPGSNEKVWTNRAFEVVSDSSGNIPEITSPAAGAALTGGSATISWDDNGAAIDGWWLYAGNAPSGSGQFAYDSGEFLPATATSGVVTGLPSDGSTVYITLWYRPVNGNWKTVIRSYSAGSTTGPAITSPAVGTTLPPGSPTFSWAGNGAPVTEWWLWAGSSQAGADRYSYYSSGSLPVSTNSAVVTGLPNDGSTVYITLWYRTASDGWTSVVTSYTAASGGGGGPTIVSPSQGTTLTSDTQTFTWSDNGTAVDEYWLYAGMGVNQYQYFNSGLITGNSAQVNNLPTGGETVYVRLWHRVSGGTWYSVDSTYTAATLAQPEITSPSDGSTIATNQTFSWSANDAVVNEWWLYVGSAPGGADL